nr:hypothetical protein [Tanacetum cinerariifolium]
NHSLVWVSEPTTEPLELPSEPATSYQACNLVFQSLDGHVSPPEWCHVAGQLSPAPSPEPPSEYQSTTVKGGVNGGQRRLMVADYRRTTAELPSK